MHKFAWILGLLTLFLLPQISEARDRVYSSDRLRLLRNATGQSNSTEGGYAARVDAIFNVTADSSRLYVANQDKIARQAQINTGLIDSRITTGLTSSNFDEKMQEKNKEKEEEKEPFGEVNGVVDTLVEGSERNYLLDREDIYRDAEKKRAEELRKQFEAEEVQKSKSTEEEDEDELDLSSNPYYFKPTENNYQNNRIVISNRLMQAGLEYDEVEELLSSSTSVDDAIIELMEDEGFTYGQARAFFEFEEKESAF